jgi:uncharacterized protein (TIRG00374 family)
LNPKIAKRFAVGIAVGALVYLGMAVYADWHDLQAVLRHFRWAMLLPVLALSLGNYLIRFLRWQMYLRACAVGLESLLSLRIFFAGLVMSVTPGKFGELLKAWLVKVENGTPMTTTGPVVVAERVTDLVALFVLLFVGSIVYRTNALAVVLSGFIVVVLIVALVSPRVAHIVLRIVERVPPLRRFGERLEMAYDSMRFLLRPRLFVQATVLGVLAWFAECWGFWLVLHGFGVSLSAAFSTYVYAFATLVGALLLIPGGLGGTEGTMIAMLRAVDVARETAVAATFLTRIATLWFAVLLGALVLLVNRRLAAEARSLD